MSRHPTAASARVKMPLRAGQLAPQGGGSLEQNLYRTGFDSGWEIDIFGGARRRVEAAQATVDAAVEDRRGVLVTLLGDVAKNYIDVRALQRRLAVAQENLKAQRETVALYQGTIRCRTSERSRRRPSGRAGADHRGANSYPGKRTETDGLSPRRAAGRSAGRC